MIGLYGRVGPASRRSPVDWLLILAVSGLVGIGILAVFSAAMPLPYHQQVIQRQLVSVAVGVFAFLCGAGVHYQVYQYRWKAMYAVCIGLLVAVLLFGKTVRGSRGWFRLPFLSFQPCELARVLLVLTLSSFLQLRIRKMAKFRTVLWSVGLCLPVLFLILKEPNLSSTIILFPAILTILFCAGAKALHMGFFIGCGLLSLLLPLAWTLFSIRTEWVEASPATQYLMALSSPGWVLWLTCCGVALFSLMLWRVFVELRASVHWIYFVGGGAMIVAGLLLGNVVQSQLKDYQRNRFVAFLDPGLDPRGASYNLLQAQIAIGSGGLLGKGFFSGSQSQLGFVPERHTDFIMAVVGEETGFVGILAVLALYLLMLLRIFHTARLAENSFGYLVACGVGSMVAAYLFINAGMSAGFIPVAGVPLPLVSYGGSNLVMTLWSLGIVQSIYSKRFTFT